MNARKRPRAVLGLALLLLALCATAPTSAGATSVGPGWQLWANTYPTNLIHGVDAVREVTPEEAIFTLSFEGSETAPISSDAGASAVQAALEALPTIGAGNVAVSEEAGSPGVYVVTFLGTLGNFSVAELEATGASVSSRTRGSASGTIAINVFNVGAAPTDGTPFTVTDTLPPGVKAKQAGALFRLGEGKRLGIVPRFLSELWDCTGNGPGPAPSVAGASVVTCTNDPVGLPVFAGGGGMPTMLFNEEAVRPQPVLGIAVEASGEASGLANKVSISGGGAPSPASTEDQVTISSTPAQAGLTSADAWFSNADGTVDLQAGSHPYTATLAFSTPTAVNSEELFFPAGEVRNLETQVPPGFIGDLRDVPQCRRAELLQNACPLGSMVGTLVLLNRFGPFEKQVFNMVPTQGAPAEFSFNFEGIGARIVFGVKTGSDYSIVAHVYIPEKETFQSILTLWGAPQEESHRVWRGREAGCTEEQLAAPAFFENEANYCALQPGAIVEPVLTLPTLCGAAQPFAFREPRQLAGPGCDLGRGIPHPRRRRQPCRLHRL